MDFLVHHLLRTTADRHPDHEALVGGDERWDYATTANRVQAVASGLRELGVERGDRVGVWLPASIPQAISLLAISAAGGVFVPMHESLFPRQIAHIVQDCQVKVLMTARRHWEALRDVRPRLASIQQTVLVDAPEVSTKPVSWQAWPWDRSAPGPTREPRRTLRPSSTRRAQPACRRASC